jgi:aminoglycoside 3-N-acetyltransferase
VEAEVIARSSRPLTAATLTAQLAAQLAAAGVPSGGTVLVHSALSRLGFVVGGAQAVVEALTAALGPDGTLVMPAQSGALTDPATWQRPPVPPEWWDEIRSGMPAYDPRATPTRGMGAVPECFRSCPGVLRSAHPTDSFAARGPRARWLLEPHPLPYGVGEGSPLGRLYEAAGHVLLLGVGHGNNTTLHLAEHRSGRGRETIAGSPVLVGGRRRWVRYPTLDWDDSDFPQAGAAYRESGGAVTAARVGLADTLLLPVVPLVDATTTWFRSHRR